MKMRAIYYSTPPPQNIQWSIQDQVFLIPVFLRCHIKYVLQTFWKSLRRKILRHERKYVNHRLSVALVYINHTTHLATWLVYSLLA